MGEPFLIGLLVASWGAFIFIYRRQRKMVASARRARDEIHAEETRVFDFLHGLGEAFRGEIRPEELHRLIVEGAMRILDAHGGTLYLADRERSLLINRYISKGCPPLIEVPQHILKQAETTPQALQSYLRLHVIGEQEGIIGEVFSARKPVLLSEGDPRLDKLRDTSLKTGAAMIAPLLYGEVNLGVLAVANGAMGEQFTDSDFTIFCSIAEQSAFALYNAIIYSEASEKRRLDADLQVAQEIQRILLPSTAPDLPGFDIAGTHIAARHVSGDYFDYIPIDDERLGVAIADVSGKGVPASLIMAMCRSVLHSHAKGNLSAAEVLDKVNRQIFPDIKEDMFISMAYAVLDPNTNKVTLCRAGHDAPLVYSATSGTVSKLKPPGMAVGIDSGDVFARITKNFEFTMEPNDCLILYTDGVTEALDSKGLEFGLTRMIQAIQVSASGGARAILDAVTDDLKSFIGTTARSDDITLIVIRKK